MTSDLDIFIHVILYAWRNRHEQPRISLVGSEHVDGVALLFVSSREDVGLVHDADFDCDSAYVFFCPKSWHDPETFMRLNFPFPPTDIGCDL